MRMKRREAQRLRAESRSRVRSRRVKAGLLELESQGDVRSPSGMTVKPGFLSHGGRPFAPVIFRQDTPCCEQRHGMNEGPKRGPDLADNHGIA